jgi:hypothetical protein
MTIPLNIPIAYFVSVVGGYVVVGAFLWLSRRTIGLPRKGTFTCDQLWIGGTERFIATTLVIVAPRYVGAFAVVWVGLKLASNWQRQKGDSPAVRKGTLLALAGNAWSLFIAIAAGWYVKGNAAIEAWNTVAH